MNDNDRDVYINIRSQKNGTGMARRFMTQSVPAQQARYDADRADEAKNEVKAHKNRVISHHFPVTYRLMTQSVPTRVPLIM